MLPNSPIGPHQRTSTCASGAPASPSVGSTGILQGLKDVFSAGSWFKAPVVPEELRLPSSFTSAQLMQREVEKLRALRSERVRYGCATATEGWRQLWQSDPRALDDVGLTKIIAVCCLLQTHKIRDILSAVLRRGHLLPGEAHQIRSLYELILRPGDLPRGGSEGMGPEKTDRAHSKTVVRQRRAAVHDDRWRHSPVSFGRDTAHRYYLLVTAFEDLFKHPLIGPPLFGEHVPMHEVLPQHFKSTSLLPQQEGAPRDAAPQPATHTSSQWMLLGAAIGGAGMAAALALRNAVKQCACLLAVFVGYLGRLC